MAKKEELFPSWSVTFQMDGSEDAKEFFERTQNELKSIESAAEKRIGQLFDEHMGLKDKLNNEAYFQLLRLFSIGYRLGWNDCHSVHEEK